MCVVVILGITTSVLGMSAKFEVWREDSRGASTLLRRVSVWWTSWLIGDQVVYTVYTKHETQLFCNLMFFICKREFD